MTSVVRLSSFAMLAALALAPATASACRDTGPGANCDAGPSLPSDAGTDAWAGYGACTPFADTGDPGLDASARMSFTSDDDCTTVHPDLVCGSEGACECDTAPADVPAGGGGCSAGASSGSASCGALLLALALVASRRRRPLVA